MIHSLEIIDNAYATLALSIPFHAFHNLLIEDRMNPRGTVANEGS